MEQSTQKPTIYIVGAGVSGLIAAINLEKLGYSPTIIESSDRVGGRVKTDIVDGYQLDHGFQVLLDAYPLAKKYLNYKALDLQKLDPGALIFHNSKPSAFGDPLRDSSFLLSTLLSNVGTLSDKWKIFKLNLAMKAKNLDAIFDEKEISTLAYLQDYGFSEKIINHFFKPFFSGIFLEPNLQTSSRMFEFVYKMFSEGQAVIPKAGMEAIPIQLKNQLDKTTFHFNTSVESVVNQQITLKNGDQISADFAIVATDPSSLVPNYKSSLAWKSCDNLYFTIPQDTIGRPIIALNAHSDSLINNIFFATSVVTQTQGKEALLSVTVVKNHDYSENDLIQQVIKELKCDFKIASAQFLKRYHIPKALPQLSDLKYNREESESLLTEHIAIAGDGLLNGSLNAAMQSGEGAADIAHRAVSNLMLPTG